MNRQSFLTTHLKLWGVLLAFVAIITMVAVIIEVGNHSNQSNSSANQDHAENFYAMIDGRVALDGATVDVSLASDLKSILGPHNGQPLPAAIDSFQGTSSAYGGITRIIGFDPFNNVGLGCNECGPLSTKMLGILTEIKSGHDTNLFKTVAVKGTSSTFTLTPDGISWISWLLLLWLIVGAALGFLAVGLDPAGFRATNNKATVGMWALSPTFWAAIYGWQFRTKKTLEQKLRSQFPQQMATVDSVNRILEHTVGTKADELRKTRDQVLAQLVSQVKSGATLADDMQLKQSMAELTDAQDFLDARAQAAKELADGSTPSV